MSFVASTNSTPIKQKGTYVEFQPIEEPKLEINVNGKVYEITKVRRRIGGKSEDWKEIDLVKLSPEEKKELVKAAERACKVFDKLDKITPHGLKTAQTLTLQFFQEHESGPGLINKTLGKIFKKFAWSPEPTVLKEIHYKNSEKSPVKTYQVHLERYSPADQEEIYKLISPLSQHMKHMVETQLKNPYTRKIRKDKNTPSP